MKKHAGAPSLKQHCWLLDVPWRPPSEEARRGAPPEAAARQGSIVDGAAWNTPNEAVPGQAANVEGSTVESII